MNELEKQFQTDPEIQRLLKISTEKIDAYRQASASRLETEMGLVQSSISLLRNRLIEYYRGLENPSRDSEIGRALSNVNTALSYVVGVEYPASGIHRNLLEEAGKLLNDLPGAGKSE